MLKLSKAQKRVLRAMGEFDTLISVHPWGGGWDIPTIPDLASGPFRPRIQTLRVLVRMGLLECDHIGSLESEYYLTPKGQEVARELEE